MKFVLDNWYLILIAAISGALLLWPALRATAQAGAVSANEAVRLINRERAVLIDVSEPADYAAGHAANSKNIPFGTLESSGDLPKNKAVPVVLVCATGTRSSRAAAVLRRLGFQNPHALAGGLSAWKEANLPIEKSA